VVFLPLKKQTNKQKNKTNFFKKRGSGVILRMAVLHEVQFNVVCHLLQTIKASDFRLKEVLEHIAGHIFSYISFEIICKIFLMNV